MSKDFIVELLNISKSFGGVQALKDVSLQVEPGEIHALVGENGAGKSTLMKVLSGVHTQDKGRIKIEGEEVKINTPQRGKQLGVSIIYQEFSLAPDLSVAENIFLDELGNKGIVDWSNLYKRTEELIESIGFNINPKEKIKNLSVAYQQVVEISKALSEDARILILDEPTAVLAPSEIEVLFEMLANLKKRGVGIIYISHRLEEVFKIADRATVLKDGKVTGVVKPDRVDKNKIVDLMIGRKISDMFPTRKVDVGQEMFRVNNLTNEYINEISFSVKKGEVFGIAGLVGNGRTEILRAIFGADPLYSGEIIIDGKEVDINSPKKALRYGIGMLPESRKEQGVILQMSVKENISMPNLKKVVNGVVFNKQKEKNFVQGLVNKLKVKTPGIETPVLSLSGGNQQKVSLAKWFGANLSVMLLDEPTRGVDVGAKIEIYKLINELAEQGLGVIMISSEMPEIVGMCDRAAVIYQGKISGILDKKELNEKNIMNLAIGEDKIDE